MAALSNIEQAKHNELACNFLSKKPDFADWIITTAFYSGIHYARYLILPYTERGITYNTFEALFTAKRASNEGRHGFQASFITSRYPEISYEYCKLLDMSSNARYMNYEYSRNDANAAKKYLDTIKQFVLDKKPILL